MHLNHKLFVLLLGFSSMLSACGPNEYYVPVNNQAGNTQPLSKTSDTVRVVVVHNFPELIKKARLKGPDWLIWAKSSNYIMSAKLYTEERLQALGYQVVDVGLHAGGAGHPNVIALVESGEDPSKTHEVVRTWTEPMYTDSMGNPTAWDTKSDSYTMRHVDYKVTLVRPDDKNNPLFVCNNTPLSTNLCVAPEYPDHYQTIFQGTGSMDTNTKMPAYILDHITTALWNNYPNMMGKHKVFLYSQPQPQIIRVEEDTPQKGS
ncbi:MAG: hypothetical protein ACRCVY_05500 [Commensalibacter sp.]